ncbi:MAG: AsnC family transcriptional regulator [Candidatus Micrarchaeia archaeon]
MELPDKIKEAIEELKKRHSHSVVAKFLKGNYYAYEVYTKWDPLIKRRRTYSLYLGKIEQDGELIPPHRKLDITRGARSVEGYARAKSEKQSIKEHEGNKEDIAILTALSTNARSSYEEIGKKAGISAQAARRRIKKLEEKYAITYTIDTHAALNFGFYRFIITVKFNGSKRPRKEEIRRELEKEPRVQLVMSTKGEFDLLIYVLFENTVKLDDWLYGLRKSEAFANLDADWNASYFLISNGLVPLRDEFFEIVKERVWHRTRETPRRKEGEIFYREYAVLRALNKNGVEKFNEIDKGYGLRKGSADYTFQELMQKKVIRRVTISMGNLPIKYFAIIRVEIQNMEDFLAKGKNYFLYMMQDKGMLTNKVIISGDIGAPYSMISVHPVYMEEGLDKIEEDIYGMLKGVKVSSTIVSEIILGSICLNKLETVEMPIYEFLKKEYNLSDEEVLQEIRSLDQSD